MSTKCQSKALLSVRMSCEDDVYFEYREYGVNGTNILHAATTSFLVYQTIEAVRNITVDGVYHKYLHMLNLLSREYYAVCCFFSSKSSSLSSPSFFSSSFLCLS